MKLRNRGIHIVALAAYVLIAIAVLGPLNPLVEVWGNNTSDVYNHLYLRYWQSFEAANGNPFPVHNHFLHYPDGGTIFLADAIGGTLAIPVIWLAGPVFGYNLLILANIIFAGWAMFWLIRRLTKDNWAAFLAGGLFALCPVNLAHVNNGVTEMLQVGWLPLFIGCLLEMFDQIEKRQSNKRTIGITLTVAIIWWAMSVGSHWYYGMYAYLIFVLVVISKSTHPCRLLIWKKSAGLILIFALMILPVALAFVHYSKAENSLTRRLDTQTVYHPGYSADPAHYFTGKEPDSEETENYLHLGYIGFAVPLLLGLALLSGGRRKAVALWLAASSFFVVLALGPILTWDSQVLTLNGKQILLPHHFFSKVIPFFSSMNFPYRFFVMVHLCTAIAIGLGLANWWEKRKWRGPLFICMLLLFIADTAILSGAPVPAVKQRVEAKGPILPMAESKEIFSVLDLPVRLRLKVVNRYVTNQIFHQRPILYSNFASIPYPFTSSLAKNNLAINLLALAGNPRGIPDESKHILYGSFKNMELIEPARSLLSCMLENQKCDKDLMARLEKDISILRQLRVTRFVLHEDLTLEGSLLKPVLVKLFGEPKYKQDDISIYKMPEIE